MEKKASTEGVEDYEVSEMSIKEGNAQVAGDTFKEEEEEEDADFDEYE